MKILIDMCLSPEWVEALRSHGHEARHWSNIGDAHAKDSEIMDWAADGSFVVLTHDLDFGNLLYRNKASLPSVIQVRTPSVLVEDIGALVFAALRQFETQIMQGALITLEPSRARARILPIQE
jgi:predicted nuclease of predicted toxin-antitoxin system